MAGSEAGCIGLARKGLRVNAAELLPALRDLSSRLPEMYFRQPWELQHVLFSLGYTDDLADEAEIGNAGFAVDAPKAQKRLRAIEKRTGELDAQRAGLDLAIHSHAGKLEKALMVARQDG